MILTNVVKVTDSTHPLHGKVLIMERIHRETMEVECFEWRNDDEFGTKQPHIRFKPEQVSYGRACIITQWLTRTPPCQTTHWLNRRKGPDGVSRFEDEHGVFRDEEFPDSDFEPLTEEIIIGKYRY